MKRTVSIVLLIALALSFAACGKPTVTPPGGDELDIPSNSTPGPTVSAPPSAGPSASASPMPSISIELPDDVDPSIIGTAPTPTPDENPEITLNPNKTVDPKNTPVPASKMPTTIKEAKALNSDTIGWVKVPNTNIDYPIMYRMKPKWYYNEHDFFKQYSSSGSIYSYYDYLTRNVIISGHNMRKSGTMFHALHSVQNNKDKLKTEKNRIFNVNIFDYSKWEVWALYETKESEPEKTLINNIQPLGNDPKENEKWIKGQKERSEIDLDVDVSGGDVLMTIITCGDNFDNSTAQSRLYFFLRAIPS